jgi:hypothetical protein
MARDTSEAVFPSFLADPAGPSGCVLEKMWHDPLKQKAWKKAGRIFQAALWRGSALNRG